MKAKNRQKTTYEAAPPRAKPKINFLDLVRRKEQIWNIKTF